MKTIYLIIGLNEEKVIQSTSLSSTGISTEEKHFVIGTLIDETDNIEKAVRIAEQHAMVYELGCEIKTTYKRNEVIKILNSQ